MNAKNKIVNVFRSLSLLVGRRRMAMSLSLRRLRLHAATAVQVFVLCAVVCRYSVAAVSFSNPKSASTLATFSSSGTYVISCTVSDGALNTKSSITIQVTNPIPAVLGMDSPVGIGGNTIPTNVTLTTGTVGISSFQFNLALPTGVTVSTTSITTGSAAAAAGKSAAAAVNSGVLTVVVAGINQNVIPSGPVVVIPLSLGTSMVTGTSPLVLSGLVASDPNAISAPMNGQNGTLSVTANAAPAVTLSGPSSVVMPSTASLSVTASDDGAPNPPGLLNYQWTSP